MEKMQKIPKKKINPIHATKPSRIDIFNIDHKLIIFKFQLVL